MIIYTSTHLQSFKLRKKNFLLLEILICLALICLCLSPLIETPLQAYKSVIENLEEIERQNLAISTFAEIEMKLLNNDIDWKKIPSEGQTSEEFLLSDEVLSIGDIKQSTVTRSFTISCNKKGEKISSHDEIVRILNINISLSNTNKPKNIYKFKTLVKKRKDPENT